MADRKRSGSRHPPDVVEYRDFRRFLKDTFRWWRARGNEGGAGPVAARVGLSGGQLSNILAGRRELAPTMVHDMAAALGLEGERQRAFAILVALSNTAAPSARLALSAELAELRRRLARPRKRGRPTLAEAMAPKPPAPRPKGAPMSRPDRERYVRVWLTNALYGLLSCPEAPQDVGEIRRLLRRYTTPTAILASVKDLRALGLVVERDGKMLPASNVADATSPEPISAGTVHDFWDQARVALHARDPQAEISLSVHLVPAEALAATAGRQFQAFYEAVLAGETSSAPACVTAERPELPPGQEPARVVLQQAMMSLPLAADGEAPESADPSTD